MYNKTDQTLKLKDQQYTAPKTYVSMNVYLLHVSLQSQICDQ